MVRGELYVVKSHKFRAFVRDHASFIRRPPVKQMASGGPNLWLVCDLHFQNPAAFHDKWPRRSNEVQA